MKAGLNPSSINKIFITHMHGDHVMGLPGMLALICSCFTNTDSTLASPPNADKTVDIYGPIGITEFVQNSLRSTQSILTRNRLRFHELLPDWFGARPFRDAHYTRPRPADDDGADGAEDQRLSHARLELHEILETSDSMQDALARLKQKNPEIDYITSGPLPLTNSVAPPPLPNGSTAAAPQQQPQQVPSTTPAISAHHLYVSYIRPSQIPRDICRCRVVLWTNRSLFW